MVAGVHHVLGESREAGDERAARLCRKGVELESGSADYNSMPGYSAAFHPLRADA